jgi:S1-C subfamily serine protease
MLGRCGLCGWSAASETSSVPEAAPTVSAAAPPPPATPADAPVTETAPTISPPVVEPGPRVPSHAAPARSAPGEARFSAMTVGLLAGLVVVAMIALYGMVSVSSLSSDISGVRDDQRAAADRLTAIEGELRTSKDNESELRAQLDAQKAADPVVIASKVQPSVFTIGSDFGVGSGWVVKSDGATSLLVTNYHVVQEVVERGGNSVEVYHDNDTVLAGTVIRSSPAVDLAVISVNGQLPVLTMSSAKVSPGQAVLVIGSPLGLGGSVSSGSVSALRDDFIQFSAPISPGNSGGPIINLSGEVVGVTEAKAIGFGIEGVGIAIPISRVCSEFNIC